jgi:hypothetical protein
MDKLLEVYAYLMGPAGAIIFGALFALSEAIGLHPKVQASGVFQAIKGGIKWVLDKVKK